MTGGAGGAGGGVGGVGGVGGGLVARLLPGTVAAEEAYGDPSTAPELFPEEAAHVARAVDKRRREFSTVRALARTALARLGGPYVPLLPGQLGAPGWPEGFTGSMTHCDGFRAATVARTAEFASLGIDAEPNQPLPNPDILDAISLSAERPHLKELADLRPEVQWERLLFSAKESVYKAWFPLTHKLLDFEEAELQFDASASSASGPEAGPEAGPAMGTYTARLLVPGPIVDGVRLAGFTGRWVAANGLVVTAIAVTREG